MGPVTAAVQIIDPLLVRLQLIGHTFQHNLCPADPAALQARLLDQSARKIALRPLEGGAAAGQSDGLLFAAARVEVAHPGADVLLVALFQRHRHAGHHAGFRLMAEQAAAVAQLHLFICIGRNASVASAHGDLRHHVLHLPAVGSGVHEHRAAHRAGNAGGKLQPFEGGAGRGVAQFGQQRAALRGEGEASVLRGRGLAHCVEAGGDEQHHAANASIAHQHIAAVAKDGDRHAAFLCRQQRMAHLLRRVRLHQHVGRAAQTQGGMGAHGCGKGDALCGNGLAQKGNEGLIFHVSSMKTGLWKIVLHLPCVCQRLSPSNKSGRCRRCRTPNRFRSRCRRPAVR